jgi:hypothetical protein
MPADCLDSGKCEYRTAREKVWINPGSLGRFMSDAACIALCDLL